MSSVKNRLYTDRYIIKNENRDIQQSIDYMIS